MTRGRVVPLTPAQVVTRALYLAGERTVHELDEHVLVRTDTPELCRAGRYRLEYPNGGTDPTAAHPFADHEGELVADCIGGAAWCGGWDRKQPTRFAHLYSGSINTNSMILDAEGWRRCFEPLARPVPGCFVVCRSGAPGHRVGHIGVVVSVPAEWDPGVPDCWRAVGVVDVAARAGRANRRTSAMGWFRTRNAGGYWMRSLMTP